MNEENTKIIDGEEENAHQTNLRHQKSDLTTSKVPHLKTLTSISIGINVTLIFVLLPAVVILQSLLQHRQTDVCEAPGVKGLSGRVDVTKPDDVSGRGKDDDSRYCFKGEKEECVERGYALKVVTSEGGQETSLCCGNLGDHMHGVMGERVSEKLRSDFYKAQRLQTVKDYIAKLQTDSQVVTYRPAAHVGILQNGNLTAPDNEVPRIQWDASGNGSFLTGGIINDGDRLTITQPGYYYVYAGLQFQVTPSEDTHRPMVAFLYRTVNGTKASRQKLITSRESSCRWTRGDATGPVSMHMAGIFLLRQHDEISVRTGSNSLLDRSPAATYLGLHMV